MWKPVFKVVYLFVLLEFTVQNAAGNNVSAALQTEISKRIEKKLAGMTFFNEPDYYRDMHQSSLDRNINIIVTYIGCYFVWQSQYTKLESANEDGPFSQSNGRRSCAEKCFNKHSEPPIVFIRGVECHCAPPNRKLNASRIDDSHCKFPCPDDMKLQLAPNSCGGNLGYSVYCTLISSVSSCKSIFLTNNAFQEYSASKQWMLELTKGNSRPVPDKISCGKCHKSSLCKPKNLSPNFDYFPMNSAQECANFCNMNVKYAIWNENDQIEYQVRHPAAFAVLTWWRVPHPTESIELPICMCGDEEIKSSFVSEPDHYCKQCPGGHDEMCGGIAPTEVFVSVYCIDNGSRRCPGDSTSSTITTTTTTTEITYPTSIPDEDYPLPSTISGTSTTRNHSTITTIGTELTSSSSSPRTTEITRKTSPVSGISCKTKCYLVDRHGYKWEACAYKTQIASCSKLIPNSVGNAYWKCNGKGQFETSQPDVSGCISTWVQESIKEFESMDNMDEAKHLASNLIKGCSNSKEPQYFGHEIATIAGLANMTLCKVRDFVNLPSQSEYENLVKHSVELIACLVNSHSSWNDLSILNRTHLSAHLMEATEDVLFHLTQFVKPEQKYSKIFKPMQQFTAAAETFDKKKGFSPKDEYEFPPKNDRYRETSIKLPAGWTNLLKEDKVEVAVITISSESLAKVMTGTGVYEVNGEKNKIINGRMISLSVTSSNTNHSNKFKSSGFLHGRSKSLTFPDNGVQIAFHHITDAWGDQSYEIRRKLHTKEKPKAALGTAQCVFWDTEKNMWSTRGCHVLKASRMETVCECSHLTSFAILMDVHRYIGKQLGLTILTLILCPLSEFALLLTILILSIAGNCSYKARTTICKHLSFCLLLGNGMILVILDRNYFYMSEGVCMAAAMAAHYVFLCAFMWMLFEGVLLYKMVVNVFDSGKSYMKQFGTIAYGSPLVIIATTAALGHLKGDRPYGGDEYCWLVGNYIWTFMVPVAVVITINIIILFIALKTAYQLQHLGQWEKKLSPIFVMEKIRSYRIYFRGCFSLTVILGVTWIVGFFTLMEGSSKVIAAYLFTILNASQGFLVFLFTCRAYIGKIRLFTQRKLSSYFPSLMNTNSNHSSIDIRRE